MNQSPLGVEVRRLVGDVRGAVPGAAAPPESTMSPMNEGTRGDVGEHNGPGPAPRRSTHSFKIESLTLLPTFFSLSGPLKSQLVRRKQDLRSFKN